MNFGLKYPSVHIVPAELLNALLKDILILYNIFYGHF